jgi:phosphomannomutase
MPEPIISVSGLRGIVGTEFTPTVALHYAAAFATTLPGGQVVLGRDGRSSGPMFAKAVAAALLGHGLEVIDADVIATPSLGVLVRELRAVGGIQISASHNPPSYNGLKLFNAQGRVLPAAEGGRVAEAYRQRSVGWTGTERVGDFRIELDPHRYHLQKVLATVDPTRVARQAFRVLLDSNHGAGSLLGRRLLESLGCQVTILGAEADGRFSHPPEPLGENLTEVAAAVREGAFDIGFCQDPDADRLAVIDELGNYIGEELSSVLCVARRLEQEKGPVVTNCASSSWMAWVAQQAGVACYRSKVGEANVVDRMLEVQAAYGGEGSGGPIDPKVGLVRDSFVGMAQILELMASRQQRLSQIIAEFPPLFMVKDKLALANQSLEQALVKLKAGLAAERCDELDGLRLDWPDRWLLLRGSNTEPIVRLIAEAPSLAEARALIDTAKKLLG